MSMPSSWEWRKETPGYFMDFLEERELVEICKDSPSPSDVKGICEFFKTRGYVTTRQKYRLAAFVAYLSRSGSLTI